MKKFLHAFLTICAGAFMLAQSAMGGELTFTYASGDTVPWGNNKLETYDVAMFIPGTALKGKKITKITVPCRAYQVATNVSLWLSSDLKLKTVDGVKCADADILQETMESARTLNLELSTPYEITENGVYVGYTLTIPSGSIPANDKNHPGRYPISVTQGCTEDGFYVHTTRTYTIWRNAKTINIDYTADIKVELEGEFYPNAVSVENVNSLLAKTNEASKTDITIVNHGTAPVNSIDYELTIGKKTTKGSMTFNPALPVNFNTSYERSIDVPAVSAVGHYDMVLKVTKVNGEENKDERNSYTSWIDVPSFYTTHRPLMEEYTSLGCVWCPQGYIALKWMNENVKDFIGASYHCNFNNVVDSMSCVPQNYWSGYAGSLPSAVIDRYQIGNVYSGNTNYHMGIKPTWEAFRDQIIAPCDVQLNSKWADDEHTAIDLTFTARFMTSQNNSDFRFSYLVIADSVSSPYWAQSNGYNTSDFSSYPAEYGWEVFTKGQSKVYGLVYDDIVIASPAPQGFISSLPENITMDEGHVYTTRFELSSVKNYSYLIHERGANLRIIAMVIDATTGNIANANVAKIGIDTNAAIDAPVINTDAEVVSVALYDLNGRQVTNPSHGIFIRAERLSDGTVRSSKIVLN